MSDSQPVFAPLASLPTSATGYSEFYIHLPESVAAPARECASNDSDVLLDLPLAGYFSFKTVVDRSVTVFLTVLSAPLMVLIALAILLLDGRPVFYRQVRVGLDGRDFRIWKFRTMRRNAERATGAVWSSQSDSRVTPLGRWLRCSHLDELPQFFNILAGQMNLVGPRPERPEFANALARELPHYRHRTAVRPGITGLAQLRLGYDHSVADVRKKLKLDLRYIRTATFSHDVWLLACTLPYIAKQLAYKWTAGRRAATRSSDDQQTIPLAHQLVAPPLRCDPAAPKKPLSVPRRRRMVPGTQESYSMDNRSLAPVFKVLSPPRDPLQDECA